MSEKEIRLIDANGLIQTLAIVAKKMAKSDAQKALMGRVLYIVDGNIKGEYNLGRIEGSENTRERERELNNWLLEFGW